jgi:uncharacterized protein YbbC (DUF1343 family)
LEFGLRILDYIQSKIRNHKSKIIHLCAKVCRVRFILPLTVLSFFGAVHAQQVKLGIDNLRNENFKVLERQRVGLVTHPGGVDSKLVPTVDVLRAAKNVNLVALFGPEHGVYGDEYAGDKIPDKTDARTGLPVYSLYGTTRAPTTQMSEKFDVLVIDLQDIGSRSYTFISTMKVCLEACAKFDKQLVILDRPNPLGGQRVEGPMLVSGYESFVSIMNVPYVHGMTMGELAQFARAMFVPSFDKMTVMKMSGWKREMDWDDTGLTWVPTSPHIPHASSCAAYAATGIIGELKQISNGVGYTLPFEVVGAPSFDADDLAAKLNSQQIEGVYFRPVHYRPWFAQFKEQACHGVQVHIDPKRATSVVEINFRMMELMGARQMLESAPDRHKMFDKVCGSDEVRRYLLEGRDMSELFAKWKADCEKFREQRKPYLLYD